MNGPRLLLSRCADIIGGADGPTSILITRRISPSGLLLLAGAVCLSAALLFYCIRRRKVKK